MCKFLCILLFYWVPKKNILLINFDIILDGNIIFVNKSLPKLNENEEYQKV